jgi:hypothetical protein
MIGKSKAAAVVLATAGLVLGAVFPAGTMAAPRHTMHSHSMKHHSKRHHSKRGSAMHG